jgi:hypothetical protein
MKVDIRRLRLRKGDILVIERQMGYVAWPEILANAAKEAGIDFSVPVVFVDNVDSFAIVRHEGEKDGLSNSPNENAGA